MLSASSGLAIVRNFVPEIISNMCTCKEIFPALQSLEKAYRVNLERLSAIP